MTLFDALRPDGSPIFLANLPNARGRGHRPYHQYACNEAELQRFIARYDKPGRSLYFTVATLEPGSTRAKENVRSACWVWADVDFKDHPDIPPEEIRRRIEAMPFPPTLIVASGHGYHLYWKLNEPLDAAPGKAQQELEDGLKLACRYVGGDTNAAEAARLLRLPGSCNSKDGASVPVEIIAENGHRYELSDLVGFWREAQPVLPEPGRVNGRDHAEGEPHMAGERMAGAYKAPIDVDQRLADMCHKGAGDSSIHYTELHCTASLLRCGCPVDDAVFTVLEAVRKAVADDPSASGWDWAQEEIDIRRMCTDLVGKNPELSATLPDDIREPFEAALAAGRRPYIVYASNIGWHVRSREPKQAEGEQAGASTTQSKSTADEAAKTAHKGRFKLVAFSDLQLGTDPLYRVDELIPIRGLVDVWGKAKCCKSFWTYDLCFHIAQGWEYRDRYVQQGAVVYCAFEGAHGYKKRKAALKQHYNIEEGAHVPLYLVSETINLISEHALLIAAITAQLGGTKPAVVVLDTLNKSLVGSENKDVDMGAYVRAAEAIRDAFDCVVIIVHHCGYDDTRPRGHSSLPAAVDAQLAVTRTENVVTVTVEMMRDGPEETQIVSEVVSVEVGMDRNGKVLTSLVVVPGSADAAATRSDLPRGLAVFRSALIGALASHGEVFQPEAGVLPVRAVCQWYIRDQFYATYAEAEEDEKKRQAKVQKAFVRALGDAQSRGMIRTLRTVDDARIMVWRPERQDGG